MKRILSSLMFGLMITAIACGRSKSSQQDTTLNTDLSLAAQQRGYLPIDSLADTVLSGSAAARTAAPTHHSSSSGATTHRSRTSSAGSSGQSSGNVSRAPSSPTVVKHTKRDAAIGAAAGAILGATTSKNKVKGGVIGAAVGGILGGVIGNNVDKTKKP